MSKISDYDFLELYDVCKSKYDLLIYLYLKTSGDFLHNVFIGNKFKLKYTDLWFTGSADIIKFPYLRVGISGKGNYISIDGCRNSALTKNCCNVNQNRMGAILKKLGIPFIQEFPFLITNRKLWLDLCDRVGVSKDNDSFRDKAVVCVDFLCPSRIVVEADSKTYHKDLTSDLVRDLYLKKMFGVIVYREYPLGVPDNIINDKELLDLRFDRIKEKVFQKYFIEETEKFSYELSKTYTEFSVNNFKIYNRFKDNICKIYEPEMEEKCVCLIKMFLRFEYVFNSKIINYLFDFNKSKGLSSIINKKLFESFKYFMYTDRLFDTIFMKDFEELGKNLGDENNFTYYKNEVGEDYINYITNFFIEYRKDTLENSDVKFIREMSKIPGLDVFEIYCSCSSTIENRFSIFFRP